MKEKEVILNGKEFKIVTRVPKEEIDDNYIKVLLDDTVELSKVIKEINTVKLLEKFKFKYFENIKLMILLPSKGIIGSTLNKSILL